MDKEEKAQSAKGKWKSGGLVAWWQSQCSVCGATFGVILEHANAKYHYCPNCGAKMIKDGEAE